MGNRDNKLHSILKDNKSGSNEILTELHEHLKGEQKMLEVFPALVSVIKNQFQPFQSVKEYISDLEKHLHKNKKLDDFFSKYDYLLTNENKLIFEKNKKYLIPLNKIVTISNSSTVLSVIEQIHNSNKKVNVIVCESRPKLEGRIFAKTLSHNNINIEFTTEAAVGNFIPSADAVLIGADMILKNGDVINKTGSRMLAVMCKYYSIPFYVVAGNKKFSKQTNFKQNEMPPDEIWRHSNSKIKIKNKYFEKVEKKLISKIFTS